MPQQARKRQNWLAAASAVAVFVFVSLFAVFSFQTRSDLKAAIGNVEQSQEAAAQAIFDTCQRGNQARATNNTQLRKPLKEMFAYVVELVDEQIARAEQTGKPVPNLKQTLEVRARFDGFRKAVKLQPQVDCRKPGSGV